MQQQQQRQALLFPGPVEALEVLVLNGQPLHVHFFEPLSIANVGEVPLRLTDVGLRACDLADLSLQQLMALMLRPMCRIARLNLSCVALGGDAVAALAGMLRGNSSLRTLLLSCCALSDPMLAAILAPLIEPEVGKRNTSVAELDISGNEPGPTTEALLVAILKYRTAPLTVAATHCAISLKGEARAAWAAPTPATAEADDSPRAEHVEPAVAVDLCNNQIESFCVVSTLSSLLRSRTCCVVSLVLDHNPIGDSGCVSLLSAMVSTC